MFYTYILQSLTDPSQRYVGHTAGLRTRMEEHNAGNCPHTSKFLPWKLKVYVAFESIVQAQQFEKYLKSGSGRAFANRHFWREGAGQEI
jgi:predicted GIY-YIG superfamily endonuclease